MSSDVAWLHRAIGDLSIATMHLQLAAQLIKDGEGDSAEQNLRFLILAERAIDISRAVRRLADDIRAVGRPRAEP